MSTYPEIDPKDIRKGDLIRWESSERDEYATEHRVEGFEVTTQEPGTHYLIDRPKPPVELPETPTLGRLTWDTGNEGGSEVAEWMVHRDGVFGGSARVPVAGVTEFVPGSFVPTPALDKLRLAQSDAADLIADSEGRNKIRRVAIHTFLTAIDKANEANS